MKYYANFNTNKGKRLTYPITGYNKEELAKVISRIAESERETDGVCYWDVWYKEDGEYICVANGGVDSYGKRWRTK